MSGRCRPEKPLGIARAEKSPLFENNQIDLDALKIERKQGQRTDLATSSENSDEVKAKPIEVAAKKAGFGGYDAYRAAQKVIERDIPELVEAMARVPPRSPMDRVPLGLSD